MTISNYGLQCVSLPYIYKMSSFTVVPGPVHVPIPTHHRVATTGDVRVSFRHKNEDSILFGTYLFNSNPWKYTQQCV